MTRLSESKSALRFVTVSRRLIAGWPGRDATGRPWQSGSVTVARSAGVPRQLTAWRERFCFIELVWLVEDFLDFFLAWCDFDDFFFFVLAVGADEVGVSGAMVCPPPVAAWA
jgi:hypothetical protein